MSRGRSQAFPLVFFASHPVTREWTVNAASGAKIKRTGYTFIPDCACTAFMVQGETLPALIGDCGDADAVGGLTEMITAYVTLSRTKSAQGLIFAASLRAPSLQVGRPAKTNVLAQQPPTTILKYGRSPEVSRRLM